MESGGRDSHSKSHCSVHPFELVGLVDGDWVGARFQGGRLDLRAQLKERATLAADVDDVFSPARSLLGEDLLSRPPDRVLLLLVGACDDVVAVRYGIGRLGASPEVA